jgi:DNA-binding response OmpR family regulator
MKVLIVDDDSLICSSLARGLIRLGHAGRAATSVESALRLIESESPGAILTDLDLGPGGDGVDLISRLRREGCQVPMIMMTGSDPVMARARLARAGLDEIALLEKPFGIEELMKVLTEIVSPSAGAAPPSPAAPTRPSRATPVGAMMQTVVRAFGGRGL